MRTFLQPQELKFYKKGKKKRFWETLAVNRKLTYNRRNAPAFKIRVSSDVTKLLPKPTLIGIGKNLRVKRR